MTGQPNSLDTECSDISQVCGVATNEPGFRPRGITCHASTEEQTTGQITTNFSSRSHLDRSGRFKMPPIPMEDLRNILYHLELKDCNDSCSCLNCGFNSNRSSSETKINLSQWFEQDSDGDNMFMLSIMQKKEQFINLVLDNLAHYKFMNIQNEFGQTCLHLAVLMNMPKIARRIIARGGNVASQDTNGNTPLHLACKNGYLDCAIALSTPLSYNEVTDRTFYVPYIRIPQNAEIRNYDGQTCLHLAAINFHFPIMEHLICKCNSDVNACDWRSGETLLHYSVQTNQMALLKLLLNCRTLNMNIARYDGLTALHMAQLAHNMEMVQAMLKAGAEEIQLSSSLSDSFDCVYDDIKIASISVFNEEC